MGERRKGRTPLGSRCPRRELSGRDGRRGRGEGVVERTLMVAALHSHKNAEACISYSAEAKGFCEKLD